MTPTSRAVPTPLQSAADQLLADLSLVLDLRAGLADILAHAEAADLLGDLNEALDLCAGLEAVAPAPSSSIIAPVRSDEPVLDDPPDALRQIVEGIAAADGPARVQIRSTRDGAAFAENMRLVSNLLEQATQCPAATQSTSPTAIRRFAFEARRLAARFFTTISLPIGSPTQPASTELDIAAAEAGVAVTVAGRAAVDAAATTRCAADAAHVSARTYVAIRNDAANAARAYAASRDADASRAVDARRAVVDARRAAVDAAQRVAGCALDTVEAARRAADHASAAADIASAAADDAGAAEAAARRAADQASAAGDALRRVNAAVSSAVAADRADDDVAVYAAVRAAADETDNAVSAAEAAAAAMHAAIRYAGTVRHEAVGRKVQVGLRPVAAQLLSVSSALERAAHVLEMGEPEIIDCVNSVVDVGHDLIWLTVLLNDHAGADLRNVDLERVLSLDGIRWSESTQWPQTWIGVIRARSVPLDENLYEIREGLGVAQLT